MVELAEGDLRALQEFDVALAAIDHLGSLGSAALGLIGKLVPCDYATYNEIDVRRRRTVVAVEPFDGLDGTDYSAFQRYVGHTPSSSIPAGPGMGAPTPSPTSSIGGHSTAPTSTPTSSGTLGPNTKQPSPLPTLPPSWSGLHSIGPEAISTHTIGCS